MKNIFLFTNLLLFSTSIIFGQKYTISGRITLENSAISLPGINIVSNKGDFHTISDYDGYFQLEIDQEDEITLTISGIGFQTIHKTIDLNKIPKIYLDFTLREESIDLPMIQVNAHSTTGGMMGSMDIPGSNHYISSKEIKEVQSTNPHDILQKIPGIQIQEEDGFGLRPNIGIRASGSERSSKITILEDGVLAAPAPYSAPSAYYFPTIARMSGIEVRKGASQIVEGPYTTGGVLNFISTPVPRSKKGFFNLGAGSFGSRNLQANYGDTKGGFGYLVETFQYSASGFKTIDFSDNETGFDKKDFIGKLKWTSNAKSKIFQNVSLKIGESKEHSDETYLGLSYDDFLQNPYRRYAGSQMDEMNSRHRQISLRHLISPIKNVYILTTAYRNTFSRNWYKLDKIYNETGESVAIGKLLEKPNSFANEFSLVNGRSGSSEESLSVKANNRSYLSSGIQSKINYFSGNHRIEIGGRLHFDEMDRFQWADEYLMNEGSLLLSNPGTHGTESNRIHDANAFALYMNYQWGNKRWDIQGGIRRENILLTRADYGKSDPKRIGQNLTSRENQVTSYIPGISITYKLSAQDQVFAGIHKGFAPPGSSPSTRPEESNNYELGYRIEKSNLFASAVLFLNDYENLLGSDLASSGGTGNGDQFNGGAVHSYGMEFALNYRQKISKDIWLPMQFQYTYNKATFVNSFNSAFEPWGSVTSGDFLPYLAPHALTLTTGLRLPEVSWNLTMSYQDNMRIKAGHGILNDDEKISARLLLSSNISIALDQNVHITLGTHNLLNKKYAVATRPAGWRPGAPRNISAGIQVQF